MVMLNETKPILVRFAVPASYLPDIRQRQNENLKVNVSLNDGRPPITGQLAFVDNAVDTTTGTIMLKGRFGNADGALWPGQFVTSTLILYVQKSVVVPAPAVMNGEKGPYVFVVNNDKADTRPVDVGRTVEDVVIVNKGITPGETVVTDGQLRLTPNAKVEVKVPGQEDGKTPAAAQGGGDGRRGGGGKKGGAKGGGDATAGGAAQGAPEGGDHSKHAS
jgi:multidrug efflux system membrane fusion protein